MLDENAARVKPAQPVEAVDVRGAFEAWARSEGHGCERSELGGDYIFGATHSAWKGWQAAIAHPRPTGDVPRYTHLPLDLWEAIAKNSVW
jgi:hypothetical protein